MKTVGTEPSLTARLLGLLDNVFPPNPAGFRSPEEQTAHEVVKASASMGSYLEELGRQDLDVLDYGCGWGGETLWLAQRAHSVTGVDVDPAAIRQARLALAQDGATNCNFECSDDGWLPFPDASFDAVFSTDTFEHVMDLDRAFSEIARVLRPGGSLLTRFGPLFYSPHGYHLYWVSQVPWAHLVFGLDAIAAKRLQHGGAPRPSQSWQDLGLNGRRFRHYEEAVKKAGLQVVRFRPIPVRGMSLLARVPGLRNLVIFGIDCHVQRPK